jgi:Ni/Co efflux regulator RcnB
MKKVLLLAALFLGTTAMVNAQTDAKATTPAKEMKAKKHHRKHKAEKKAEAAAADATKK